MKVLLIALLSSFLLQGTEGADFSTIETALKTGDAETLSQYFDANVEVAVTDDIPKVYNKAKAKELVNLFFRNNKPTGFQQRHKGMSKGKGYQYFIGNLETIKGSYRVTIVINVDAKQFLIQEIGFNKN
ncbi:MAG: DUF4783 domain-containing protein [Bacteroidota bacterium]